VVEPDRWIQAANRLGLAQDHGQALVETALALSLLVFTLMGGADIARVYAATLAVENASRAGAEAAVMRVAMTDPAIASYASDELGRVSGVDATKATITVTHTTGSGGESLVNVRVQYTFRTLTPWPGVPNAVALDRTATFRNYP
jgi:TadE-like protein.